MTGTWAQPTAQESQVRLTLLHSPPTWVALLSALLLSRSSSLTLVDFLLVAELGRVLLFSWEELELFSSSSSSSSSSKLMLLEMPGPGRGVGGDKWSHRHTQSLTRPLAPSHPFTQHTQAEWHVHTYIHAHIQMHTRTLSLRCICELGLVTVPGCSPPPSLSCQTLSGSQGALSPG